MTRRLFDRGARALLGAAAASAAMTLACATRPAPVTKLWGGRQITTRPVDPNAYEHASRAFLYQEEERWADAAAELQRALMFDGASPEIRARLGEVFLRLGRPGDAAREIRTSLDIAPTISGLVAEAHWKAGRGDLSGAVASLERATGLADVALDPDGAEIAYLELGDAALQALEAGRARRALEDLCRALPGSAAGRLRLAGVAWAEGDMGAAEHHLHALLAGRPDQIEALVLLAHLHAALGRPLQAREAFGQALDRSEGAPEVGAVFAEFLVGIGDGKEAERIALDLAPADASDADALARWLPLAHASRQVERALGLVRALGGGAAPEAERAKAVLHTAALLATRGARGDAAAVLLAVPAGSPVHREARLRAAGLLIEDGKAADAARALEGLDGRGEEAAEIDLAVARAEVEDRLGDPARAAQRLGEALARYPSDTRLVLPLATIEERRGDWRRALALVEPLLARQPGSAVLLNFWGFVAAEHGHDLPLARRRLASALAIEPAAGSILDSVGWAYFKSGDLDRAGFFLEQAGRIEFEDPEILAHLGELYARRADGERAAAAFRKALASRPDDTLRRRIEARLAETLARKAARP